MEVTKALMKRGCRQVKEKRGLLPIHLAVKANSPALVQELMIPDSYPSTLCLQRGGGGLLARKSLYASALFGPTTFESYPKPYIPNSFTPPPTLNPQIQS